MDFISPKQLIDMLRSSIVEVDFFKKDGSKRRMKATLNFDKIPDKKKPKPREEKDILKEIEEPTEKSFIRVFDIEKGEWRGFIVKSIFGITNHGKSFAVKKGELRGKIDENNKTNSGIS